MVVVRTYDTVIADSGFTESGPQSTCEQALTWPYVAYTTSKNFASVVTMSILSTLLANQVESVQEG
jgi:hypothetical protein